MHHRRSSITGIPNFISDRPIHIFVTLLHEGTFFDVATTCWRRCAARAAVSFPPALDYYLRTVVVVVEAEQTIAKTLCHTKGVSRWLPTP